MAVIGYARVATDGQQAIDAQVSRLCEAGCEQVFVDKNVSGTRSSRPEWGKALAYLRQGDLLVAVRLDRFGRDVRQLLNVAHELGARGAGLMCLDQPLDTTTESGMERITTLAMEYDLRDTPESGE